MAGNTIPGSTRILTNDLGVTEYNNLYVSTTNSTNLAVRKKLPSSSAVMTGTPTVPDRNIDESGPAIVNTKFVHDIIDATFGDDAFHYPQYLTLVVYSNSQSTINLRFVGAVNGQMHWTDTDKSPMLNGNTTISHTFPAGLHQFHFTGKGTEVFINSPNLIQVADFGEHGFNHIAMYDHTVSRGCPMLDEVPNRLPTSVTDCRDMFREAVILESPQPRYWDTARLKNVDRMFMNAKLYNTDLSRWCVPQIQTIPNDFATGATKWTAPKPVWGTCPSP